MKVKIQYEPDEFEIAKALEKQIISEMKKLKNPIESAQTLPTRVRDLILAYDTIPATVPDFRKKSELRQTVIVSEALNVQLRDNRRQGIPPTFDNVMETLLCIPCLTKDIENMLAEYKDIKGLGMGDLYKPEWDRVYPSIRAHEDAKAEALLKRLGL